MFNKAVIFGLGFCLIYSNTLWGFEPPASWGMTHKGQGRSQENATVVLPLIDRAALTRYYDQRDQGYVTKKAHHIVGQSKGLQQKTKATRPYQFAEAFEQTASLSSGGTWLEQGGTSIWRLSFQAENALGLNIGFSNVKLPSGARLYVYDETKQLVLGPYTAQDNKRHGELWTPVIKAQSITIELNVPSAQKSLATLSVSRVNQSFREIKMKQTGAKAGNCNINVVCPDSAGWEKEIRSVARYTISGTGACSGTLVNNTNEDLAPYFLSADHCNVTIATAPSLVFYWNYQTANCNDPTGTGTPTASNSGSTFVAASAGLGEFASGSDFVLVLMDTVPTVTPSVYWAGWDNRDRTYTDIVGIHHPSGDEKSISFDRDSLLITDYLSNDADAAAKFLRIGQWDKGTTEPGSSGSGLWNTNFHLVGTLSGGNAACNQAPDPDTEDNDEPDWYGRIAAHWNGDGTRQTRLSSTLDPLGMGASSLNGRDFCAQPSASFADPDQVAVGEAVDFTASNPVGGAGGPYTYAWDLDGDGTVDSTLQDNLGHTFSSPGVFQVSLVVKDSAGCPFKTTHTAIVTDPAEIFVANTRIPTAFVGSVGSNGDWFASQLTAAEGNSSAISAGISHGQHSDMVLLENFTASAVTFAKKVSSEGGYDCLAFYVDGQLQGAWSAEQDWSNESYMLTAGVHTLLWRYIKDGSDSAAADAAWIDSVQYTASGSGTGGAAATVPSADATICDGTENPTPPTTPPTPTPTPTPAPAPSMRPSTSSSGGGVSGGFFLTLLLPCYIVRRQRTQYRRA